MVAAPVCHCLLTIDTPERYAQAQATLARWRTSVRSADSAADPTAPGARAGR
jgi:hypothetical protein